MISIKNDNEFEYLINMDRRQLLFELNRLNLRKKELVYNSEEILANIAFPGECKIDFNSEENSLIDLKIAKIKELLNRMAIEEFDNKDVVSIDDIVTLRYENEIHEQFEGTFKLVDREPLSNYEISIKAPLGECVYGLSVGDVGEYTINNVFAMITVLDIKKSYFLEDVISIKK